ncbi:hypothetical protein [cyanobacterium endosymbiont of Epithemia clementina EcSB]|uniref:hypothetical protein n=1 Tax=cyanobacterium endosymbiont of Epithemia clementina EcSB TaxID=3034674 RepID=UPI0024807AE5|nr:hypothetical protein [cyanobacterium endosymbiont of Epithemia clementina EcSB]WGT67311.1 hypothetical protein P3F56_08910 [cyanobacterium endosymbiont of Epithemia clementina EcSB]
MDKIHYGFFPIAEKEFPSIVNQNRFAELMPWVMILLSYLFQICKGEIFEISRPNSNQIRVCHQVHSKIN